MNCCEIRDWFWRNTYNNKIFRNGEDTLEKTYYLGANLSEEVKAKILEKNGEPQLDYAGATLEVIEKEGEDLGYFIIVYLVARTKDGKYAIGNLLANLRNVELDWRKFIDSYEYIDIDVDVDNIFVSNEISEGFKVGCVYFNNRVIKGEIFALGITEILEKKKKVRNFSEIFNDKGYLIRPNLFEYTFFSRTPSTCRLAKSISNLLENCQVCENEGKCDKCCH